MLKFCIEKLMRQQDLEVIECEQAIDAILDDATNPLQIAAFLVLLRAKKETSVELTAIVNSFQKRMIKITTHKKVLDIVGTGGDGANTINISTGSAILAASCGVSVAKHGNRAVSSQAGAADVLRALGINIDLSAEKVALCIDEIGIGFCYSPLFHPALSKLKLLRQQLNITTTLNILGPLLNPAQASHLLLGSLDESLLPTLAKVLQHTGCDYSAVVHGGGIDEISCMGITKIIYINHDVITKSHINPLELGLNLCQKSDLQGGSAIENAEVLTAVFSGKRGAIADTLMLNAAVALYLYGHHPTIQEALAHTRENLYNLSALRLLKQWRDFSNA